MGAPRPAIFVVSREPPGLEFPSRCIPFDMDAMYGVTPDSGKPPFGFYQLPPETADDTCLRIEEVQSVTPGIAVTKLKAERVQEPEALAAMQKPGSPGKKRC